MKEKLEIIRRTEHMNASELAKKLGVEASAISHIKSGRNKPSFDFVVKILAAFPHINPDWLLLDRGSYLRSDADALPTALTQSETSDENDLLLGGTLFSDVENIEISEVNSKDKNDIDSIFPIPQKGGKTVERIIVLYSDKSFESYNPTSR